MASLRGFSARLSKTFSFFHTFILPIFFPTTPILLFSLIFIFKMVFLLYLNLLESFFLFSARLLCEALYRIFSFFSLFIPTMFFSPPFPLIYFNLFSSFFLLGFPSLRGSPPTTILLFSLIFIFTVFFFPPLP